MSSRETSDTDLASLDGQEGLRPSWLSRLKRMPPSLALAWAIVAIVKYGPRSRNVGRPTA